MGRPLWKMAAYMKTIHPHAMDRTLSSAGAIINKDRSSDRFGVSGRKNGSSVLERLIVLTIGRAWRLVVPPAVVLVVCPYRRSLFASSQGPHWHAGCGRLNVWMCAWLCAWMQNKHSVVLWPVRWVSALAGIWQWACINLSSQHSASIKTTFIKHLPALSQLSAGTHKQRATPRIQHSARTQWAFNKHLVTFLPAFSWYPVRIG